MTYSGPERRRHARISGRFMVSYRILAERNNVDITQTRNLSLGGILITTNRQFETGTKLALEIRLPFDPDPIMLTGKVIESNEITKDLIYDTRIEFLTVDEKHRGILNQTVEYYLKRDRI